MKRILVTLLILSLLTGICMFSASAAVIVEDNFNSGSFSSAVTKSPAQQVDIMADPTDANDKVVYVNKKDTGSNDMGELYINFPKQTDVFTVEADLYHLSGQLWVCGFSGKTFPYGPGMSFGPAVSAFDGASQTGKASGISSNKWQRIGVEVDPAAGTYKIYANGTLQTATAFKFRNEALKDFDNFVFRTPSGSSAGAFYIDNIKVYSGACDAASTVTKKSQAMGATPTPEVYQPADQSKYEIKNNPVMKEIFVSPTGNDSGDGSASAPFKTLTKARDAASAAASNMTGDIVINLLPGEYFVSEAVELNTKDSGKNGYNIIWRAKEGPLSARIYGSERLTGWTKDKGDIWKVNVNSKFYTLYEEDTRAIKARFPNREFDVEYPTSRAPYLLTNDPNTKAYEKIIFKPEDLKDISFSDYKDANIVVWPWNKCDWQMWVSPIEQVDKANNTIIAKFKEASIPIGLNARYYIEGMYELLDMPGEFHLDRANGVLYYIPLNGDPNASSIYAPKTKEIFTLTGVSNVIFDGISFEKTDFVDGMKGWFETGMSEYAWKGAITFTNNNQEVKIINSRFKNTGITGVFIKGVSKYNYIANTLFENIGNSGIIMTGSPNGKNCMYNKIENVLIHDIGETSIDCAGINLFTGQGNIITNVEVYNSPRYAVSIRGNAASFQWFTRPDDLDNIKYGGQSKENIVRNCRFYETNQDSGDTGSLHTAGIAFGVEPYNVNHFENIYIDSIYAHPSMMDWAPNGIFNDYQSYGQSFKNIKITNENGGEYAAGDIYIDKTQQRLNETDYRSMSFDNVSWLTGFDDSKMDYKNMGLTDKFPAMYQPGYDKLKNAVILQEGTSSAMANGKKVLVDQNNPAVMPVNIDWRVLVPIRFIAESFGADVSWDDSTNTATVKLDGKTITMVENSKEINVDGKSIAIDVPAMIMNDRTFIPIRAVSEALGKDVFYERGFISVSNKKNLFDKDKDQVVIDRVGSGLLIDYDVNKYSYKGVGSSGMTEYTASASIEKDGEALMLRSGGAENSAFISVDAKPGAGVRVYERIDGYSIPAFKELTGVSLPFKAAIKISQGHAIVYINDSEVYKTPVTFERPLYGIYSETASQKQADLSYGTIKLPKGEAQKLEFIVGANAVELNKETLFDVIAVNNDNESFSLMNEKIEISSSNENVIAVKGNLFVGKSIGKAVISAKAYVDGKEFTASLDYECVEFNSVLIDEKFDKSTFSTKIWTLSPEGEDGSYVKINDNNELEMYAVKSAKPYQASRKFDSFKGQIQVEFDFKAEFAKSGEPSGAMLAYLLGDGNSFCISTFAYEGYFTYFLDGEMHKFGNCVSGKTYKVKIDANVTANTYDVYIDGNKEVSGVKFRNAAEALNGIQMGGTSNAENTKLWWDNVKVTKSK